MKKIRNPKSEIRNNEENPNQENHKPASPVLSVPAFDHSNFLRVSGFGFRISLLTTLFFAAVAPTLTWLEFSGGSENLVVGTVLEMRRGGAWLIPTLKGEPRTTKPPLTTWLTATAVTPDTIRALSDPQRRDRAYRKLAWQTRWPALASSCLLIVATAFLGRVIAGDRAGLLAAAIAGSSLMWLVFGRSNSTDVQLALWVTVTNVCFAYALFTPRRWIACIAGGIALGLALMSKGPVALVQTVVPLAVFATWQRSWTARQQRPPIAPFITAALIALIIALPWPLYVLSHNRGQLFNWWREVFRTSDEGLGRDPAWVYFSLIPLLVPWSGLLILGIVSAIWERTQRSVLALALIIVPILIMGLFKDKAERYLLPMLAPAAVLCGEALLRQRDDRYERAKSVALAFTWSSLAALAIGLPLAGLLYEKTVSMQSWWNWPLALAFTAGAGLILIVAWTQRRRGIAMMVVTAIVIMLAVQALFMHGYASSANGRSELKPLADAIVAAAPPDAEIWDYQPSNWWSRVPNDLGIYLNRTIRPIEALPSVSARFRSQVILIYVPDDAALPETFQDAKLIGQARRNKGEWRAYSLRK